MVNIICNLQFEADKPRMRIGRVVKKPRTQFGNRDKFLVFWEYVVSYAAIQQ